MSNISNQITIAALPPEVMTQILSDDINVTIASEVCSIWRDVVKEHTLAAFWTQLTSNPPKGPIDLEAMAKEIERMHPNSSSFKKFEELHFRMKQVWNHTLSPKPSAAAKELSALQDEQQKLQDESLEKIWTKIAMHIQPPLQNPPKNAAEIRKFLNDDANIPLLASIRSLELCKLDLKVLPPEISKLSGLEELYLTQNQLTYLPASIGELKSLKRLMLYNNKLTCLPDSLCTLPHLEMLSIDNNELACVPSSIGDLPNLRYFFLENNKLIRLPESICKLPRNCQMALAKNPWMFISNEVKSKISCIDSTIQKYNAEQEYGCHTPLALLYQTIIISQKISERDLQELFQGTLSLEDQQLICEMVSTLSGKSPKNLSWGQHHLFDNREIFSLAVREAIIAKLNRLDKKEQERVIKKIYSISKALLPKDKKWDMGFVFSNIPRLADAMAPDSTSCSVM